MGFGAQLSRLARLIVTIEPIDAPGADSSPAPELPSKPGLLSHLFAIEALGAEEEATGDAAAPASGGPGLLTGLFAIESLPMDEPAPAAPPAPYLKWLMWPETLGPDEK